jgi:hypothetical protein
MVQPQTNTNTALGLAEVEQSIFRNTTSGARDGSVVPRRVVVLTDGGSSDPVATANAADSLRTADVVIVAVGVGSFVNATELEVIAGSPDRVFQSANFQDLNAVVSEIVAAACDATV